MPTHQGIITTDEYGERLFVGDQECYAEDGEIFDVLASIVPQVKLSAIPVGIALQLCDRVYGSNDLCGRSPYAILENSAEHGFVGHLSTPFFPPSDNVDPESLRSYFQDVLNAGQHALVSLQDSGRLLSVESQTYDDIAYLSCKIKLFDQSLLDAEKFMRAIEYRITTATAPPTLFMCHASEDKAFVERLVQELDQRALYAWYDKREILVGDSIVDKVNSALARADFLVAILSPRSATKPWVIRELGSTLMRQLNEDGIVVLPVLLSKCKLPALLSDIKYADFTSSFEEGLKDLLSSIRARTNTA